MKNNSLKNLIVLIFWIFLIFLFFNELFTKPNQTNEPFKNAHTNTLTIYNFNTSWCGHSINFQPTWDKFVNSITDNTNIIAIDAKCDDNKYEKLIEKYNIEGFPTIIIDDTNTFIKYNGKRTVNGLRNALKLNDIIDNTQYANNPSNHRCGGQINNNQLTNTTNNQLTNNQLTNANNKTKIYNFNTSWCGYSVRFQSIWDKFADSLNNPNIDVIDVKCDNDNNKDLCQKYDIPGYPSVIKVTSSNKVIDYEGPRTIEGLINFANN